MSGCARLSRVVLLVAALVSAPPIGAQTAEPDKADEARTMPADAIDAAHREADALAASSPGTRAAEVAPGLKALHVPPLAESVDPRLGQYQNTRDARVGGWTDDGGLLIATRFGETRQMHRVDRPLGARQQLTFESEPVRSAVAATWRGRPGFFYLRDVGGAEAYQVFFFDSALTTHALVTDGTSRHAMVRAARDGTRIGWSSTQRNGRDYDLWVMELSGDAPPRMVRESEGFWHILDFSPNGRDLLVRHYTSANESGLYVLELPTGRVEALFDHPARAPGEDTELVSYGTARYAPDGKGVYYVSNRLGQFKQLAHVDLASRGARLLTGSIPWDVEDLEIGPRGKRLAFVTNEDGVSRLHLWKLHRHKPIALRSPLPMGVIGGLFFDAKGHRLAVSLQPPTAPSDAWVVDLRRRKAAPWTRSEVGGLDTARMSNPEQIRYPTFDEVGGAPRQIPAFYFRPAAGPKPAPVIVLIHGGPESQYRPRFSAPIQHWVRELGVAVIAPNVRGSAGYGKDWLLADNGYKRLDSVKDIGALLDWIRTRPELDADRVAVYGGSYGGYMVLAAMARYADRLKAGAEMVGISNFVTFLEHTKPYRRDLRRAEYGDERDLRMREFLQSISPTTLAPNIVDPLLVGQGLNDPRVPASESEQIVASLEGRKVPVWYVLAEDEGHGFRKKKNTDYWSRVLTLFWRTHLLHPD